MPPDNVSRANELLKRYYRTSDKTAEAVLEEIVACLRPLVRGFLARKGARAEDLEDICSDTTARLVVAVRNSRPPGGKPFDDCVRYARTIAKNAYIDLRRRGDPWRPFQLCVLQVLQDKARDNPFARWQNNLIWLGGFARWRGRPFRPTSAYLTFCEDDASFRRQALGYRDPAHIPLPELMAHLFRWLDTPLEEDELVTHLTDLRQVSGVVTLSTETLTENSDLQATGDDPETSALHSLAMERLGAQVWEEVCRLRPLQRAALLLGMEWDDWLSLGWSPIQVADALEISHAEMTSLWRALPLPDRAIAERLGVREEQVPNLRKCAKERLRRRCPGEGM